MFKVVAVIAYIIFLLWLLEVIPWNSVSMDWIIIKNNQDKIRNNDTFGPVLFFVPKKYCVLRVVLVFSYPIAIRFP